MSAGLLREARMLGKLAAFFSNAGYATWVQSLIVIGSVAVAIFAIKETNTNVAISNSLDLAKKYFTDKPTLASANLRLRISQYQQVQQAKKTISGYDREKDVGFAELLKAAGPLVAKQIKESANLQDDYNSLNDFFSGYMVCVTNKVCDRVTSVNLLAWEVLGFYNAACPYMEDLGRQYRYDDDSPRYVAFLVDVAGYKDQRSQYFCKDAVASHLSSGG